MSHIKCSPNPSGLCMCGCGAETNIASQSITRLGHVAGEPVRFIHGHTPRVGNRKSHVSVRGYRMVRRPKHRRAHNGYVPEHRLIAERALGKPLASRHPVHHVNGDKTDNRPGNLVVCEDDAYHHHLHARTRAYEACGNAGWVRCYICKQYDDPANNMWQHKTRSMAVHRECAALKMRLRAAAHEFTRATNAVRSMYDAEGRLISPVPTREV